MAEKDIVIYLENGIMHGIYGQGVVIDLELIRTGVKERLELSQGKSYPIFVDGREIKYWTLEARKYGSSPEALEGALAFAILINSPIIKTIVNWSYKIYPPKSIPLRIFTDKDKALQWLKQFKK